MEDKNVPKIHKNFCVSIGTVMGIVVGGFGGGAMVFNQIQTKILHAVPGSALITIESFLPSYQTTNIIFMNE